MAFEINISELDIPGGRLINVSPGDTFRSFASSAAADDAAACFVEKPDAAPAGRRVGLIVTSAEIKGNDSPQLICASPRQVFFELVARYALPARKSGMHETAVAGAGCIVDPSAYIGPYAVLGDGCVIGRDAVIEAHAALGDGVRIGEGTRVCSGAVIYADVSLGKNCIIHGGCVLGSDGYGFAETPDGLVKIPQVGTIRIGNDVEIGANCCIDRATLDETVIEDGVKIDNLVHIAHNVTVGQNTRITAQCGIAGSSTIGRWVVLAGQAGVGDHCSIGDHVVLTAQAGTAGSIPKPGVYSGTPARPMKDQYRIMAYQSKLETMWNRIKELEKRLDDYEKDSK